MDSRLVDPGHISLLGAEAVVPHARNQAQPLGALDEVARFSRRNQHASRIRTGDARILSIGSTAAFRRSRGPTDHTRRKRLTAQ
jgi:hypothetical protein